MTDSTYAALIQSEYQQYITILVIFGASVLGMVAASLILWYNAITKRFNSFMITGGYGVRRDRDGLV